MGAVATTTNPSYYTTYVDNTTTTFTPGVKDGALNGTTDVTVCASPAASTQRVVKFLSVYNEDTIAQDITVKYFNGTTERILTKVNLSVGDTLYYVDDEGFTVKTATGAIKSGGVYVNVSNFLTGCHDAINLTNTIAQASGVTSLTYLGLANKVSSSIDIRYRVTTAAATITWAEIALYKNITGLRPNVQNAGGGADGDNPMVLLGYTNVSAIVNSTGLKTTNISLTTPAAVGDCLYIAWGSQATTNVAMRGGQPDNNMTGIFWVGTFRPSTTTPQACSKNLSSNVPWITGYLN